MAHEVEFRLIVVVQACGCISVRRYIWQENWRKPIFVIRYLLELKQNDMNLQKEIKQSSFRNEHQRGLINIIYTYNWVCNHMKEFLKPYGITMQQFNVLRILNGQKLPISTHEIRARMLDKMSDASRIVNRLHKKGLVKRNKSTKDRRLVDVKISITGKRLVHKIDKSYAVLDGILGNLEEHEVEELNNLLDKLRG